MSSSSSSNQLYLQDQEIKQLQYTIAIVTIIMSCFAIFLTIVFFVFNIRYRNFRLIKMSSPNINNIINFNCVLLYLCPILNSIKGLYITNEFLASLMCQINTWLLPIGSTAIYAAMLAKAWRIYKIFETTPKAKKIVIKDLRLVFYILCLIAFDALIVGLWQMFDTIKLKPRYVYELQSQPTQVILPSSYFTKSSAAALANNNINNKNGGEFMSSSSSLLADSLAQGNLFLKGRNTSSSNQAGFDMLSSILTTPLNGLVSGGGVGGGDESDTLVGTVAGSLTSQPVVQNYSQKSQLKLVFECYSSYNEVWVTILTMYKIILLMYGIYLAWIIRNINVPSMNDSKYLLLSTYTIIVCGLGSMTLMQLLSNWPDVVQAFFTIGIILSTCTTQCLLFIPKIRLWYKRKNDDNFKISLSQVFLHASSNCYYTSSDKPHRNSSSNSTSAANMLNIEEELCELLHENSQLKNYLKEKEEIIKLLQEKIRMAKAKLIQVTTGQILDSQQQQFNNKSHLLNTASSRAGGGDSQATEVATYEIYQPLQSNAKTNKMPSNAETSMSHHNNHHHHHHGHNNHSRTAADQSRITSASLATGLNNLDNGFDVDSSTCTATTTTETLQTNSTLGDQQQQTMTSAQVNTTTTTAGAATQKSMKHHLFSAQQQQQLAAAASTTATTEQLKNDLDEVEELTSRVRDSISIDLSNTRRYSPLLYEYYRKQLELAKSIQSTYNIQCHTLFDAMTLMRKCLKDYCQTVVHNPEYLAIDAITSSSAAAGGGGNEYTYNDFLSENNLALSNNKVAGLNTTTSNSGGGSLPFSAKQILFNTNSSRLQKPNSNIAETTTPQSGSSSSSSGSTSFASTCSLSTTSLNVKSTTINNLFNNKNYESTANLETTTTTTTTTTSTASTAKPTQSTATTMTTIDNKQTYV